MIDLEQEELMSMDRDDREAWFDGYEAKEERMRRAREQRRRRQPAHRCPYCGDALDERTDDGPFAGRWHCSQCGGDWPDSLVSGIATHGEAPHEAEDDN